MFLFGERFAFKRKPLSLYTSIYLFRFTFWSPAQKSGSRSHCKTPHSATHHQTQTNQSHLLWNDAENTSQDFECCFWIKSRKNKQANKKNTHFFSSSSSFEVFSCTRMWKKNHVCCFSRADFYFIFFICSPSSAFKLCFLNIILC